MEDIKDLVSLPDPSAPEEATKNINNANLFGMDPTNYKTFAPVLDKKADALNAPQDAMPAVKEHMQQSTEHTAQATQDLPHLNFMEQAVKYAGDIIFNRPTKAQQIIELSNKKMDHPDQFTSDDDLKLLTLNGDLAGEDANYHNTPPSFPSQVGEALLDTGRLVRRNADLIGTFTGIGAGAGFMTPVPGGVAAGAFTGLGLGIQSALATDAYTSGRGAAYNELSNWTNPDGTPKNINETTKRYVANGFGVASAAIMATVGRVIAKSTPFLNRFISPTLVRSLFTDSTNAAILKSVTNIGEAVVAGGVGGGAMGAAHVLVQEMANSYDGTEASLLNALEATGQKISADPSLIGKPAALGAATTGILATAFNAARLNVESGRPPARDVTPAKPLALPPGPGEPPAPLELPPSRPSLKIAPTSPIEIMADRASVIRNLLEKNPDVTKLNPNEAKYHAELTQELNDIEGRLKAHQDIKDSTDVLQLQDALESVNKASEATKLKDLSPLQMQLLQARVLAKYGLDSVWVAKDDVVKWANTPEKGAAARDLIDPAGTAKAKMNATVDIPTDKFIDFISKNPGASDLMRAKAEGPSASQGRTLLTRYQDADAEQLKVLQKLGLSRDLELTPKSNVTELTPKPEVPFDVVGRVKRADEILKLLEPPSVDTIPVAKTLTEGQRTKLTAELDKIKTEVQDHYRQGTLLFGDWSVEDKANALEENFIHQQNYTRMLADVIPKEEQDKFNSAVAEGKKSIQEDIDFTLKHEMEKVQDVVKIRADQEALEEERSRIENDPRYALVDKFRGHKVKNQKGRAFSVYSIDPKTLSDDQLHYLDNPRLKEHRVFNKPGHGNSPDQAAELIGGVKDGNELLKVLAGTPTREQITKARAKIGEAQRRQDAAESVDLNWMSKLHSYDKKVRLGILLMKYMREKAWPATKQGIKRIAFPPPQPRELQIKARANVMKTKVGKLNIQQYRVGEVKSRKLAVSSYVDGQFEKAFIALEAQANNVAMQKFTLIGIGQVNKALSFIASLSGKKNLAEINNAGRVFRNARDEILDVFNFDPSKKNTSQRDSYMKFVQSSLRKGKGDFSIPAEFTDIRGSVNDLTVQQLLVITERLRAILHLAKLKNQILKKHRDEKEELRITTIRKKVKELLTPRRAYSDKKVPPIQQDNSNWGHIGNLIGAFETSFTNMEHILRELDDEKFAGYFQELLYGPLKGDGFFDKTSGYTRELEMTAKFKHHHDKLVEKYGKDFQKLESVKFDIPEFAKVKELNFGKNLTKGDLLTLAMMGGDPYLKDKRFTNNGGVGHDVMEKVFDKHLETKDIEYGQAVIDMFKDYRTETAALQKRVTGQGVDFVEGIPFRHRGKWYAGGYMPAKYRIDYTKEGMKQTLRDLKGKKAAWFETDPMRAFASEQTEQGRLISRTGSNKPLDYSWMRTLRGHEEVIHDLCYREAVIDALHVLKDKEIREHVIKTIGIEKYKLLVGTVVEIATKAEAENLNYFGDQTRFFKWLNGNLKKKFDVTVLAMNPSSMLVQFASTGQTIQNMGPKGIKHWADVNALMAVRPDLYAAFYEFANELDPTIGHYLEGLHNKLVSNVMEIAPKKRNEHVKWAADTYDKMINGMMSPMQIMDILIKIQAAMAAYSQFVHGDVEGFPIEKVLAMSNNERYARAQAYVRQISRLSLTHGRPEDRAPFQKLPMMDFLSYYWNDARNGLNNEISMIRRIRGKISEGNDAMNGVGGEPPGGSGGGEPPNTGTGWAGEAIPEPKAPDWKNVGKGFGGAAGLILFTMVAQMFTRMWEDKVRGTQETPLDAGLDLKSKEGLKQAAAYMGSYAFTSPADQLLQNHPLTRPILFAASNIWSKSKVKRVDIPLTKEATDFATTAAFVSDYLQLGVSPTPAQVRALLQSISYTMLPMPINGFNHIGKLLGFDDPITRAWDSVTGTFDPAFKGRTFILDKQIGQWKDQHAEDAPKEMIASLDQIQKQINPDPVNVPRGTTNQIKFAENGGDWTKPPLSEFEWRDIMNRAPQLGLTEAGRTSKDQTQIDKALDWTNDQNAHTLRDKNVPVNEATLYGAHKLGAEKYSELHKTPANEKAKTVLGQSDYASNPEIAAHKTVGQVKKHYADRMTEASKNLTLQTSNNED